jgi:hypothetical protein
MDSIVRGFKVSIPKTDLCLVDANTNLIDPAKEDRKPEHQAYGSANFVQLKRLELAFEDWFPDIPARCRRSPDHARYRVGIERTW